MYLGGGKRSLFCLGFLGFVFLKRHWGGKGERWQGTLAPWVQGASPFLWAGKAASLPLPSPALFLGSPLPPFPTERQTGVSPGCPGLSRHALFLSLVTKAEVCGF